MKRHAGILKFILNSLYLEFDKKGDYLNNAPPYKEVY